MPRYDLVVNAIDKLANRVGGLSSDEKAHKITMGNLGLQNARLGYEAQNLAGNRELQMAKFEREKYLDESVTFGEAIQSSKFPDQAKARLAQQFGDILNLPTTRRKAGEGLFNWMKQISSTKEAEAKRLSEIEQKGLDRASKERVAKEGRAATVEAAKIRTQGKPEDQLKGLKLRAWKDYLENKASPRQKDLIGVNKDPNLSKAIELIKNDDTMFGKSVEEVAQRALEISKKLGGYSQEQKTITREQAVEYMRKANGDKGKAKAMAIEDGYQF